jgi:hypothetical protein
MPEETRTRLTIWERSSAKGEYLAAQVLRLEKFTRIDPIHPLGGPDGKKDLICYWQDVRCVAACWFPNNSHEKTEAELLEKFEQDLAGVSQNGARGFVFVTNVAVRDGLRQQLDAMARQLGCLFCHIYHREALVPILDNGLGVGIRLLVLGIEMAAEEQQAFVETILSEQRELSKRLEQLMADTAQILKTLVPEPGKTLAEVIKGAVQEAMNTGGTVSTEVPAKAEDANE